MMAPVIALWFALQITPELRQHVEAGLAAKRSGDLDTAVREFRRVAELAPAMAAAHVNLGAVYNEKKEYANAIAPLRKALELDPGLIGAHEMLGIALLAQGYASQAIPHLEKARADALLGVAMLESGHARDAVDKLEAALEKQPDNPDLLYYLGQAHAQLSKQALEVLTTKAPISARAHQVLGESSLAAGQREAAEKHLRAALAMRSDLRGIHFALGELYLGAGDYEHAETEFREEVRLNPGSAAAAYKLGLVLSNRGESRTAIAELERANALQPDMPEALLELGKATAATGDLPAAEKFLRKVLDQEQESGLAESAHFQLAQIYRKLGRAADAGRHMKRFQELRARRK